MPPPAMLQRSAMLAGALLAEWCLINGTLRMRSAMVKPYFCFCCFDQSTPYWPKSGEGNRQFSGDVQTHMKGVYTEDPLARCVPQTLHAP